MAIKKQYLKSKPVCKVTFSTHAKEAESVAVVGDFNNWEPKNGELKKLKSGIFKGTFEVPKDGAYEFRYIVDGNYKNESEADRYQWNDYAGAENSVVEI